MGQAHLTSTNSYYEDFTIGDVMRHARGKTIGDLENVMITNMVMNTAAGHFDEHFMAQTPFGGRLSFGGVNLSVVVGLASQDTSENALAELRMDKLRLRNPVMHGDTLYAYSEVLGKTDGDDPSSGEVTFRHWGVNQNDKIVVEVERTVLIKKKAHWLP